MILEGLKWFWVTKWTSWELYRPFSKHSYSFFNAEVGMGLPGLREATFPHFREKMFWGPQKWAPDLGPNLGSGEDVSWRNGFPIRWNGGPSRGDET